MPTRQSAWLLLLEYHFSLPAPVNTLTILSGVGDEDALQVLQLKEIRGVVYLSFKPSNSARIVAI